MLLKDSFKEENSGMQGGCHNDAGVSDNFMLAACWF